uniref:Leishmanolysin-like peptidase n=1 Tax=Trichobilharzia regenti TaxID=157069 RepID=A0AA85KMJ5_TRIRE
MIIFKQQKMKSDYNHKTTIVQRAINFWENALTVKNTSSGRIHVQRYCEGGMYNQFENGTKFCTQTQCRASEKCGNINIPSQYLSDCLKMSYRNELTTVYPKGSGLQADGYLLFVDSQNTGSCLNPSTNAYANSCQMDPETD